jgi:hypothetical protein
MTSRGRWALAALLVMLGACPARAQSHPNTATATVPAGTWYFAVRAFDIAGRVSGFSNVVRVDCPAASVQCTPTMLWDRNPESELAGYVLVWGTASGVYTESKTIPVVLLPGKLPAPSLRIRQGNE